MLPDFLLWLEKFKWLTEPKLLVQLFLIAYALIWLWRRIVGTQAERLVKGLIVLIFACLLSGMLGLTLITSILQHLIPVAILAMLITFQPEIRRGLGYLGKMDKFRLDLSLPNLESDKSKRDIEQIISAVADLSRNRIGALVVVEPPAGERDYLSPGTAINADISSNLLSSIFSPKSPLHDGAVVIRQHKIIAAGVILPMTADAKLSSKYGTRHRAAIGLSEIYDGLCIVISEETGSISAASRGMLVRYNSAEELTDPLSYIYDQAIAAKQLMPWDAFANWLHRSDKPQVPAANLVLVSEADKTNREEDPAKTINMAPKSEPEQA